jgi:hypothetical protein
MIPRIHKTTAACGPPRNKHEVLVPREPVEFSVLQGVDDLVGSRSFDMDGIWIPSTSPGLLPVPLLLRNFCDQFLTLFSFSVDLRQSVVTLLSTLKVSLSCTARDRGH